MELSDRFWNKVDKTSSPNGCWLWNASCFKNGYGQFSIDGKTYKVHRLTLSNYLQRPILDRMIVTHQCPVSPNRKCCNPNHLKEATCSENNLDKIRDGNSPRGIKNPTCKLNETQVREIRASDKNFTELARLYNVTDVTIRNIKVGHTWTWLT